MRGVGLFALCLLCSPLLVSNTVYGQASHKLSSANGVQIRYEEFGSSQAASCLVLLHGASGPSVPFYRDQAKFFGAQGFFVLMPYLFDATGSSTPTTKNYHQWVDVILDFISQCHNRSSTRSVFLVGYSLGSSVALAAGSGKAPVNAIAAWYGSLPDEFFYQMKGMPPLLILHGGKDANIPIGNAQQLVKLCDLKQLQCEHYFYPDQEHGFTGKALEDADERTLKFFAQHESNP